MSLDAALPQLRKRFVRVYGRQADAALQATQTAVNEVLAKHKATSPAPVEEPWSEQDVVLITYADQLKADGEAPLATLRKWLVDEDWDSLLSIVHLLPFCPYTSDDGFSVVDYLEVDPESGDWSDIAALGEPFDLMFDLVLNHISQASDWFQRYLKGEAPYDRFFIEADPSDDLSLVVRPRSLPLLTPVETANGPRHVWTTFSADQIDLNYAEPEVLARMLAILVEYALRGARIVRLDAVAFLWKELGTECLHLPQTHEIVKIARDLLQAVAPQTLVLTETNVPHAENVSYFGKLDTNGQGDEAQMVYQFSLPPLLLDAFINGDAQPLRDWLAHLSPPPSGCTFFNFTASHDGIGVRPLEGLVSEDRFSKVIEAVRARGGRINTRRRPDGSDVPYELNITYVDALSPTAEVNAGEAEIELHARRFLAAQAVMMGLAGMPAIYFHSLVGSRNDIAGLEASGQNRRINRHKYTREELEAYLAEPATEPSAESDDAPTLQRLIYDGMRQLMLVRTVHKAFHPSAPQRVIDLDPQEVLAVQRTSLDSEETILVLVNVSPTDQQLDLPGNQPYEDLFTGTTHDADAPFTLTANDFAYLRVQ